MMLGAKMFMEMPAVSKLPYDAEIEWIESSGTQWIDTGVKPTTDTTWLLDFSFSTSSTGQLMGSGWGATNRFNIGIESNHFRCGFGNVWFTVVQTPDIDRHLWKLQSIDRKNCVASIDNGDDVFYVATDFVPSYTVIVFKRRAGETGAKGKLYSSKIICSGVLVSDLIPVRFTNDLNEVEGAVYDRVSHQILRNLGTGSFVIGPDKT